MHDNFQASAFTGVGGKCGDKCKRDVKHSNTDPYTKFLSSSQAKLGMDKCQIHVFKNTYIKSHDGQVGYTPIFHSGNQGLTPTWGNLPYMSRWKKCALHEHISQGIL